MDECGSGSKNGDNGAEDECGPSMKNLDNRRKTFSNWSKPRVCIDELSRAGFYFCGNGDETKCAYCKGVVKNWSERDEPVMEHARLFPACLFILNPPDYAMKVEKRPREPPKNTNMMRCRQRLNSFEAGWFSDVKPEELVSAGFYFIGFGDTVKCYHCGLGLNHWGKKDKPWREHARWNPECLFVKLMKGESFIANCKKLHMELLLKKYHQVSMDLKETKDLPTYIDYSLPFILKGEEASFFLSYGISEMMISKILKRFMLDNGRGFVSRDEIGKVLSSVLSLEQ
jgi:baculoviral IAP repeat-containing protein 2/3